MGPVATPPESKASDVNKGPAINAKIKAIR